MSSLPRVCKSLLRPFMPTTDSNSNVSALSFQYSRYVLIAFSTFISLRSFKFPTTFFPQTSRKNHLLSFLIISNQYSVSVRSSHQWRLKQQLSVFSSSSCLSFQVHSILAFMYNKLKKFWQYIIMSLC